MIKNFRTGAGANQYYLLKCESKLVVHPLHREIPRGTQGIFPVNGNSTSKPYS